MLFRSCFVSNGNPDVESRRLAHFPDQCVPKGSARNTMSFEKIRNLVYQKKLHSSCYEIRGAHNYGLWTCGIKNMCYHANAILKQY